MKKKKVIKMDNVKSKPPILGTASWMTILHYWSAPQWLMGIFAALIGLVWIGYFIGLGTEEVVDIFEVKEDK